MSVLASVQSLSKSFGARTLFDGFTLELMQGERLGLIGPNGSGKSTLLKIIAGRETPDHGDCALRKGVSQAYVPQQDEFDEGATVEQVLASELAELHVEPHERAIRAAIMLGKLGFDEPGQLAATLSGGWRKRLAIGRALVQEPDLLLLDEPTNHLDLEGILWLEKLLAGASFSFVVVSHDRYLLENAANRIVEINRAYPEGYFKVVGPYSEFLERREEFLEAQARQQVILANKVRREVQWLRQGAKARTSKSEYRIRQAGQLQQELQDVSARNDHRRSIDLEFSSSQRKANKLLVADGLAKSLGGRELFRDVAFTLAPGDRLGLLGVNGSGKTTLVRLLTGELPPDAGTIKRAFNLRVVCFDQNRAQLDPDQTLRNALAPNGETVIYNGAPTHVSAWAKRFLFQTEQLDVPIGKLSGGEQARILIANLMRQPADVLVLDEPTNDLDIASLEVLEESLLEFPGAIVLITHDRYMLDRVSTAILAVDGQGGIGMYADYEQWLTLQAERQAAARRAEVAASKKPAPQRAAAAPKLTYKEQQELAGIEARILTAEEEVEALQRDVERLATTSDHAALRAQSEAYAAKRQQVQTLYARWEELEARQQAAKTAG